MTVDILLATYNGEAYLPEQIDSILSQSFSNFTLYIRDDGSTDSTIDIIESYCAIDSRVKFVIDDIRARSAGKNFFELIKMSTAEYVFFADQDDIWLPNKVEKSLSKIIGIQEPCLLYVNGLVVNKNLDDLSINVYPSNGLIASFNNIMFHNGGIQGCALVVNKKLIDLVRDKENIYWYMHDQVMTFYAISYGQVIFLNEVLFLYRQHDSNVVGYQNRGYLKAFISIFKNDAKRSTLLHKPSVDFIKSFYLVEQSKLKSQDIFVFDIFFKMLSSNKVFSFFYIFCNGFTLKNSRVKLLVKSIFFKFKG